MIINNAADLPKIIALLSKNLYWTYDIETTGLNPRSNEIIGFGCASESGAFYIIHKAFENGVLVNKISKEELKTIIELLKSKRLITFNGSFDTRFTYHYFGVDLIESIYCDVMLLVHTTNENRQSYKLKDIAAELLGDSAKQEQADMLASIKANGGTEKEYYKADAQLMAKYGLADNIMTLKVYNHYLKLLKQDGLENFFFNDEVMPLYKYVTIPMERDGVPLDIALMNQTLVDINQDMVRLHDSIQNAIAPYLDLFIPWFLDKQYPYELTGRYLQKFAEFEAPELPRTKTGAYSFTKKAIDALPNCFFKSVYNGLQDLDKDYQLKIQHALMIEDGIIHPFNIQSKHHLKLLFFNKLKEIATSKTDKGNAQCDDKFLEIMAKKYDWVKDLQIYNKLSKIKSTYIERFLDKQQDGIFYPSFFQHRTTSGRYSGDLQQLSRPMEIGEDNELVVKYNNLIRRFFVSGAGYTFADLDYDSQEVKVFAHVSGEDRIKQIFENGEDFYSGVCLAAEKLQGYSANKKADNYLGKVNKPARQRAKAYALGLAFNMSPYKLKFELNCGEHEAQQIYNAYFEAFPKLKIWLEGSKKFALENGYIRLESGRIRRMPELKRYYKQYGNILFDGLELWKEYNEMPSMYAKMKEISGTCKNLLNNAANVQIQGLAASITNRAAVKTAKELKKAGLKARICNVIHDQITVLAPDTELEQASSILQHCMETAYPISVKLTAPLSSGKNWAESK